MTRAVVPGGGGGKISSSWARPRLPLRAVAPRARSTPRAPVATRARPVPRRTVNFARPFLPRRAVDVVVDSFASCSSVCDGFTRSAARTRERPAPARFGDGAGAFGAFLCDPFFVDAIRLIPPVSCYNHSLRRHRGVIDARRASAPSADPVTVHRRTPLLPLPIAGHPRRSVPRLVPLPGRSTAPARLD